ncbi:MAG: TonB-dependent receptor domain-containing protein [Sphingomonadales bacterium]
MQTALFHHTRFSRPKATSSAIAFLVAATSSLALLAATPAALAQESAPSRIELQIDIPSAPLGQSIITLSQAYDVQILAPNALIDGERSAALSGSYDVAQALTIMLSGTGLKADKLANGNYVIAADAAALAPAAGLTENAGSSITDVTETLVVTGSRIERTAVNSPAPIDIVTAEDIAKLGLTDTTEALRFVPALNSSSTLSTAASFREGGFRNFGVASLNLRGLGEDRTLVLVNGRRHVSGIANEQTVDVTTFPTALIERVEVLTGGGSSIYGADAVSGVVNYVLKDDFEGVDVRGNVSVPTQGAGEAYYGAVTLGGNFKEGRGNAAINVEYFRQSQLRIRDRPDETVSSFVGLNNPQLAQVLGVDPAFRNVLIPNARIGIFAPGPLISFTGTTLNSDSQFFSGTTEFGGVPIEQFIDPSGLLRARDFGIGRSGSFFQNSGGDGADTYFSNPEGSLIPDFERYVVNAIADYDFTDSITGFIEAKYVRNRAESTANQPVLQSVVLPIRQDNPFTPQQIQDQFASLSAQNLDPNLVVSRAFFDEAVMGGKNNTRETFRIIGGFEGEISPAFSYEISANFGRTEVSQVDENEAVVDRFYAAADVVADPGTGEPICRSDIDPSAVPPNSFFPSFGGSFQSFLPGDGSCSPLNIFAPLNGLSPEAVDFIFVRTERTSEVQQLVLNATITGSSTDFLNLPGGAISYAAGAEYREEKSENRTDEFASLGLLQFAGGAPINGRFDVFEGFAEVNVPVLANLPFARSLAIDASVRFADYSNAGSATSFAFGTVWQPVDDLRIRASFNRSVRAPNISELFRPVTVNPGSLASGSDPCDPNSVSAGSENRAANCAQLVPDLDTFDPTPSYQPFSITRIGGCNPELNVETADTYTIGFAYTPAAVPGLSIVADYYNIKIDDAIGRPGNRQVILANCADAPTIDNPFCATVTRDPATGVVTEVREAITNIAEIRAQGIDYQIAYSFDLDRLFAKNLGNFNAQLAGTYLIQREDQGFAGFPETTNQLDGELNFPKHFFNFALGWVKEKWSVDYGFNFSSTQAYGGGSEPFGIEEIEEDPFTLDQPFTGSGFVHFLGGAYKINDAIEASLRVNNLFNRDPFNLRAFGAAARPTSFIGRTVQLGVQARF